MRLTIELVPKTSWYNNVRSKVSKNEWDILRRECYKKANFRCEICNSIGEKHPVEAHEIWEYDDTKKIQKLVKLISLCPKCHQVKHFGLAQVQGKIKEAKKHFMDINNMSEVEANKYIKDMWTIWYERNKYIWKLDLTNLDISNFRRLE